MNEVEIRSLIENVAMEVGCDNEFTWDGGQDGAYYFDNPSNMTESELRINNSKLDELSKTVSRFLIENDMQESHLWNS